MADTAAYLVDELLPVAPYRQWVLTFPWVLWFRLAVDRKLMSALLSAFLRVVFSWQHLHSLTPAGLFVLHKRAEGKEGLTFVALPPPSDEEVEELTIKIARRLTRVVERLCAEEEEPGGSLEPIAAALQQALATCRRGDGAVA